MYIGADVGKLYALNPINGSKIWEFTEASSPPQSFRSSPIVGPDGTIYAKRSNGYLYAIYPNGTLKWKTQVYYDTWVSPALGRDSTDRFTVEVALTDGQPHRLGFYFLDWDYGSRSQRVDAYDAHSGFLVDSRSVSAFSGGSYYFWRIAGCVRFEISRLGAANAVVSGLFLDP